jgi:hypothetical protein
MINVKAAVASRSGGDLEEEHVTQTVRVNGELRRVPVGTDSQFRIGQLDDDIDLTEGITDDDLRDTTSGVGRELRRAGAGGDVRHHDTEMPVYGRDRATRVGSPADVQVAIDDVVERCSSLLPDGWESDNDFASEVASIVVSDYPGLKLDRVMRAIRSR